MNHEYPKVIDVDGLKITARSAEDEAMWRQPRVEASAPAPEVDAPVASEPVPVSDPPPVAKPVKAKKGKAK